MDKLMPRTKRIIVLGISLIGVIVTVSWAYGSIQEDKALIILSSILAGFFSLLKGVE